MSIFNMKSVVPVMYVNLRPNSNCMKADLKLDLTDLQYAVLIRFCVLLMETKFTSIESKMYMQYPKRTQEMVAFECKSNVNTVKGKIRYDNVKLKQLSDEDLLKSIVDTKDENELKSIDNMIINYIKSYPRIFIGCQTLFTTPLPECKDVYSYQVTDEEFDKLKILAEDISVKRSKEIVDKIGLKGIGYLKFLFDSEPIASIDLKRKSELLKLLE